MRKGVTVGCLTMLVVLAASSPIGAHVTIRSAAPLTPGGFGTITLSIPNERHVDTTKVVLEVPDDFLRGGGRISRVEFPAGWIVTLDKQDIPAEIFASEDAARKARAAARASSTDHGSTASDTEEARREEAAMDALRRRWTKRVVFEGGAVPPEGWAEFRFNVQLPREAGRYRFGAIQVYADGKEVAWTQLVEGAQRPAPTLAVDTPSRWSPYAWPAVSVAALILALASFGFGRKGIPSTRAA